MAISDAAQLHPGGKSLQQPAGQYDERGHEADRCVTGHASDREDPEGHQAQREKQAGATPVTVGVGPQNQGAERTHQEARSKRHQREHQGDEGAAAREECPANGRCVVTEHHEVVHLQEISAGDADHGPYLGLPFFGSDHGIHSGAREQSLNVADSEGKRCVRHPQGEVASGECPGAAAFGFKAAGFEFPLAMPGTATPLFH